MKLLSHYIENQIKPYPFPANWENHMVGDMLAYAYRDTEYDRRTFPSNLHYHDYYELVLLEQGDIQYVCESSVYEPERGDVILIPPGKFHMSLLKTERTCYRRHVFYLYPSAFDAIGHPALCDFLERNENGGILSADSAETKQALLSCVQRLRLCFEKEEDPIERARALAHIIHVFCSFNRSYQLKGECTTVPENVLALQQYINENYAHIGSVSEVAEHFFYSREYVSRLFKKYFDTTISDYITKRRIAQSQTLITQDLPLIDVAYQVGFSSLSTFIRSFRTVTGMTPSAYRRAWRESF